jgi:hypothetical protein
MTNWKENPDKKTIIDAKLTVRDYYPKYSFGKLYKIKNLYPSEYLRLNVSNTGLNRIKRVKKAMKNGINDITKLANIAYPENEKVFERDLSSVIYHSTTNNYISPIIVGRYRNSKKVEYIKLDGVHRIISSIIRGGKIRIAFVELELKEKS